MKKRCPFVYCFIGTVIYVFFSEFNYSILFLFPSQTYALYLGAAGPLRIVLSSHRTHEGLHSDWGYIGIRCLKKKKKNCMNLPQIAGELGLLGRR